MGFSVGGRSGAQAVAPYNAAKMLKVWGLRIVLGRKWTLYGYRKRNKRTKRHGRGQWNQTTSRLCSSNSNRSRPSLGPSDAALEAGRGFCGDTLEPTVSCLPMSASVTPTWVQMNRGDHLLLPRGKHVRFCGDKRPMTSVFREVFGAR